MIIEISVLIIAVCMVLLLVVALIVAINLQKSLKNVNAAVTSVELKVDTVVDEVSEVLTQTTEALATVNEIAINVKDKIDATDPLFASIAKIGLVVESLISLIPARQAKTAKFFNFTATNGHKSKKFEIDDVVDLVGVGINLWQKIKQRN